MTVLNDPGSLSEEIAALELAQAIDDDRKPARRGRPPRYVARPPVKTEPATDWLAQIDERFRKPLKPPAKCNPSSS